MKKYPARATTVLVGGHGLAWQAYAQHPVSTLRQCLKDNARRAGHKPDVLMLESCLMSNLESLNTLRDAVVASTSSMGYRGATHTSIQGHDQDLDTREYASETGFREWARLLEDIQEERP